MGRCLQTKETICDAVLRPLTSRPSFGGVSAQPTGEAMYNPSAIGKNLKKEAKQLTVFTFELDWLEPLAAYERLYSPYSFLLESVGGGWRVAERSFIGINPRLIYQSKNGRSRVTTSGRYFSGGGSPLDEVFSLLENYHVSGTSDYLGGAFGYLSYDAGRFIEKIPYQADDDLNIPDCLLMVMSVYLCFDHVSHKLNAHILTDNGAEVKALSTLEYLRRALYSRREALHIKRVHLDDSKFVSNFNQAGFEAVVKKAKEYIYAGDIYQVNLSQRLTAPIFTEPLAIYRALREVNPSPFAGYFNFGDWHMVGCSPERLIKLTNGKVELRPIAGTIRRGSDLKEDRRLTEQLIKDIKERAEHIMLVDLERNDLGRVAEFGTVNVDELMVTEEYSHVIHIVSNVIGRLRRDKGALDLVKACFPGGTITGCPKVRAMEIIEELEPVRRGPYTGSMGYLNFNGDLDLNIIIRTLVIKDGLAHVQAGAGIVADSVPEKEYYETLYKAEALIKATTRAEMDSVG